MEAVLLEIDISILEGHRGQVRQDQLFEIGRSKLKFPHSRHNKNPSLAVDIAEYPIQWDNIERWLKLSLTVKQKAAQLGIQIEWGGDWNSFKDEPHWQLKYND